MPDLHELEIAELARVNHTAKTLDTIFGGYFKPRAPKPKPESDELAQSIAAATDRDLHNVDMWLVALREDVAYNEPQMKQLLLLAMNGEDLQFGVRLAQAIRRQVIHNATEETRDEWEEAHDQ